MATYVNDLRLKEIATGDESGTWGTSTNTNLELIAEAFSFGTEAITTNADTHTTTIADGSTDPGRSIYLKYTGALDSDCTITIGPNTVSKLWFIENATSGSQNIIISQGSGANITIPNSHVKAIYSDGAGSGAAMVDAFTDLNVAGDFFVGDDLTLLSDASVLGFGADTDTTLTHVADTGILLNSTRQLQFGDSGTYIHQSADGVLDLVSDTELELNATTIDMNGNLDLSGTINGVSILADATNFTDSILISQNASTGTLSSASDNVGLGDDVFAALTSGRNSVAIGSNALDANTSGKNNVAVGHDALSASTTADGNTAVGKDALLDNTTGTVNTAIGRSALANNTTADNNTAVGREALFTNTTGANLTAVGNASLYYNTTANNNTAVGYQALFDNTTGTDNTAVGVLALENNTTGLRNTGMGREVLGANTTGEDNTGIGYQALLLNTEGVRNVAAGFQALDANTTGDDNTAIGYAALGANTTAHDVVAIGNFCLDANTTGTRNTAVGRSSLSGNTTANNNTAFGFDCMTANTTGAENTAMGAQALDSNTTASNNTAIGRKSLEATTTGHSNTAMGETAGQSITGSGNTAIGREAMQLGTGGEDNVAVGYRALQDNTGDNNVGIGRDSLLQCTSGGSNVAVGQTAGQNITTGTNNICIGKQSGEDITTGGYNVCIAGSVAADGLTTGSFNTYMAYKTNASAGDVSGEIVIGAGNNNHTGKGTNTGFITPNTGGVFQGNNSSSWSTTSDKRIKKNIKDNNVGLDAIKDIRVRNFEYRTLDEITDFENPASAIVEKEGIQLGVIAQEIETILPDIVKEESTGVKTVNPDNLTWYLVNAVKELSTQVDELKQELKTLKGE
jgi:hypothetical protein